MLKPSRDFVPHLPPYRVVPESVQRIMATTACLLALPAVTAGLFFGYHALKLILLAAVTALASDALINRLRQEHPPGGGAHSVSMALLLTYTLPAATPGYVVVLGVLAAVLVGKQFFGGMGQYVWHPALVGRVLIQVFFAEQLSGAAGGLLGHEHAFWGNIFDVGPTASWFSFDWFTALPPAGHSAFQLPLPTQVLRDFSALTWPDSHPLMSQYLLDHLPSLPHCMVGAIPGGMGETCAILLILLGCYALYRGYVRWQMPAAFLFAAYVAAMVCPIIIHRGQPDQHIIYFPILMENPAVGFTYVNYQLFTGELLLGALLMAADMTSRPLTCRGQVIFAVAAGALAIALRPLYPH
jgi:Na+-translocating ferredoxin:NAD+ oxidoreductase subunit D